MMDITTINIGIIIVWFLSACYFIVVGVGTHTTIALRQLAKEERRHINKHFEIAFFIIAGNASLFAFIMIHHTDEVYLNMRYWALLCFAIANYGLTYHLNEEVENFGN